LAPLPFLPTNVTLPSWRTMSSKTAGSAEAPFAGPTPAAVQY
jgi:hypothetical protein